MQGQQQYQPELFIYHDIEAFIPPNHLLRKLNRLLDLSFIREVSAPYYSHNKGRPSIDPEVFFRMLLIGYLYGIDSDRRLCEELNYNIAYRWFCRLALGDRIPEHSSFTRIRDRLGEDVFAKFFSYVLNLCKEHKLIKGERIIIDSTLVKADAALDSLKAIEPGQAKLEAEALSNKTPLDPMPTRKISNQSHISTTDPDASLARKNGSPQGLKYKVHNCVDAENRIILDTKVTTGKVHDTQTCLERIEELDKMHRFNIQEIIADRGYGSLNIITTLNEKNIKTYIPLFSSNSGSNLGNGKRGFIYNEELDIFTCPNGKYLLPRGKTYDNLKAYYTKPADCKGCSYFNKCEASKRNKSASRFIRRNIKQNLYDKILKDMNSDVFKNRLMERHWKIEGLFAEAKENHCLDRAKYRGTAKMQIQAYLVAATQNLKRLVKEFLFYFQNIFSLNLSYS